jgi:arabinose-5-phosphate isomerase
VAMALGDALAMTLMEIKQISPERFAYNHPAGQLGKRLTLKVRDLMHAGEENPTLPPEACWIDVVSAITRGGLGAVNIITPQGGLLGLITDGDLRRWMQKTPPAELETLQAGRVMTSQPITVLPDELAYEALKLMENRPSQISVLSVVNEDRQCVGLLRVHDIVRCGL